MLYILYCFKAINIVSQNFFVVLFKSVPTAVFVSLSSPLSLLFQEIGEIIALVHVVSVFALF